MTEAARSPSPRSLRSLDALNVFLADVRDGVGPYLGIYLLAGRGWNEASVGTAMAIGTIAGVIAQTPAGAMIDRLRRRRELVAAGSLTIGLACVAMALRPSWPVVYAAQAIVGVAAAFVAPAIVAISLGLVGRKAFDRRTGRNEAFNHAGNVAAAVIAGLLGHVANGVLTFWLVGAFGVLGAIASLSVRGDEIDETLARGADVGDAKPLAADVAECGRWAQLCRLLGDRRVAFFAASVVLFHFANAYMLPLVGQRLASMLPDGSTGATAYMSACIVAAQLVMVPVGLLSAWAAQRFGRRPTFLVAFAILPIRGVLYTLTDRPYVLVAIQMLDGVGAGIFGVVSVLVIADLTRGSGRFNLLQGAVGTAVGVGASLSAYLTGHLAAAHGYDAGFLFLATVAAVACALFFLAVPETKDDHLPQ